MHDVFDSLIADIADLESDLILLASKRIEKSLKPEIRDGDGDSLIYDGTPDERAAAGESAGPGSDGFDKWFGDSKIVDSDGNPLKLYHASHEGFDELLPSDRRQAIYASPSKETTEPYGDFVHEVYMKVENPVYIEWRDIAAYDITGDHDGAIGFHWVWESEEAQKTHPVLGSPMGDRSYTKAVAEGMGRHVDKEGRAWFEVVVLDKANVRVARVSQR